MLHEVSRIQRQARAEETTLEQTAAALSAALCFVTILQVSYLKKLTQTIRQKASPAKRFSTLARIIVFHCVYVDLRTPATFRSSN